MPFFPCCIKSGTAPTLVVIIGFSANIYSVNTNPNPSQRVNNIAWSKSWIYSIGLETHPVIRKSSFSLISESKFSTDALSSPSPTITKKALGIFSLISAAAFINKSGPLP